MQGLLALLLLINIGVVVYLLMIINTLRTDMKMLKDTVQLLGTVKMTGTTVGDWIKQAIA